MKIKKLFIFIFVMIFSLALVSACSCNKGNEDEPEDKTLTQQELLALLTNQGTNYTIDMKETGGNGTQTGTTKLDYAMKDGELTKFKAEVSANYEKDTETYFEEYKDGVFYFIMEGLDGYYGVPQEEFEMSYDLGQVLLESGEIKEFSYDKESNLYKLVIVTKDGPREEQVTIYLQMDGTRLVYARIEMEDSTIELTYYDFGTTKVNIPPYNVEEPTLAECFTNKPYNFTMTSGEYVALFDGITEDGFLIAMNVKVTDGNDEYYYVVDEDGVIIIEGANGEWVAKPVDDSDVEHPYDLIADHIDDFVWDEDEQAYVCEFDTSTYKVIVSNGHIIYMEHVTPEDTYIVTFSDFGTTNVKLPPFVNLVDLIAAAPENVQIDIEIEALVEGVPAKNESQVIVDAEYTDDYDIVSFKASFTDPIDDEVVYLDFVQVPGAVDPTEGDLYLIENVKGEWRGIDYDDSGYELEYLDLFVMPGLVLNAWATEFEFNSEKGCFVLNQEQNINVLSGQKVELYVSNGRIEKLVYIDGNNVATGIYSHYGQCEVNIPEYVLA